jgi:hypothetical protein
MATRIARYVDPHTTYTIDRARRSVGFARRIASP